MITTGDARVAEQLFTTKVNTDAASRVDANTIRTVVTKELAEVDEAE